MDFRKFCAGLLTAVIICAGTPTFAEDDGETIAEVPTDIYLWVQSTPRADYWFNYRQIGYRIRPDGTLDLNTLLVPTVCMYDNVQIEDVIQKRRWRKMSMTGYDRLAGRADYLKFDLLNETVQIVSRVDLDDTWAGLDEDTSGEPLALRSLQSKDVRFNFYRTILQWARDHNDLMIRRSRGKLSAKDARLKPNEMPINRIFIPPADY